jgi:deoxyhypusine synthase
MNKGEILLIMDISRFLEKNFKHFNARELLDAAKSYRGHIEKGGKMLVSLAGAMSTAELGISLAEMIRRDKVHAISSTGANLEEDIINLIAHDSYKYVPNYRDLTPEDEEDLFKNNFNRVTDTCIPEDAFRRFENIIIELWLSSDRAKSRYFPHEFIYHIIRSGRLKELYQINVHDSWVVAACEKNLPLFSPGWEDSTLGNIYAAHCVSGQINNVHTVRSGVEYLIELSDWYIRESETSSIGFFQIGGGIAGDFAISVVPLLQQDLKMKNIPLWGYFCQISDSTTSYGSYSGATPNEKITWGKLSVDTPKFMIESDASIVAPLLFAYVLHK